MFLQLFIFFLSSMPFCSSQTNEEIQTYLDCSPRPFICGGLNINISFPFQIDGRPPSCGHPGYALRCIKNTTLVTTISDREYQVLAIDYANVHIAVADARFIGNSCPVLADNTTVDLSLYQYTDLDKAVTLFMNCTFSGGLPPGLHNLSCYAGKSSFYVVGDGSSNGAGESCGSVVQVVMHQAVVDLVMKDEVELGEALQQGLTLTWTAGDGWCDACVADGGLCGYNSSLVSKNICICAGGSCSSGMGLDLFDVFFFFPLLLDSLGFGRNPDQTPSSAPLPLPCSSSRRRLKHRLQAADSPSCPEPTPTTPTDRRWLDVDATD